MSLITCEEILYFLSTETQAAAESVSRKLTDLLNPAEQRNVHLSL